MQANVDHVGPGHVTRAGFSWRVCDCSIPEENALHVVAFVEAHQDDVEIVWVGVPTSAPGRFRDLDSALDAIDDAITTGEVRGSL